MCSSCHGNVNHDWCATCEEAAIHNYLDSTCEHCGRRFNFAMVYGNLSVSPVLCTPCLWDDDIF